MIIHRMLELLDEKSLKMSDLCRYLGINTSTMTNWKNRETDPPAKFIAPICEFCGCSYEYLLTGKESECAISSDDSEWLALIHQLPINKRDYFKGKIEGYLEGVEDSVAAEPTLRKAK